MSISEIAALQDPSPEWGPNEKQAGRRVLIVDRDENALIALKRSLGESYDVATARGGLEALQLLCQCTFDFVLLDDNVPDLSGEVVVRQVRKLGTGTPVVVMQSVPPSYDLAALYASLGACFFINRRDPGAIAELVHDYFSRTRVPCTHCLTA
jgi:CheY-like chemotaxis protein